MILMTTFLKVRLIGIANESARFFRIPKDTGTMNTDPGFDIVFCKLMILVNNLKRKLKVNSF